MRSTPFVSPSVGPAGDLLAISLPAGEAHAIIIDNPSGSWLTVFPIHDFVPPYTMQWSRDFPYTVANATVRYTDGPSGQISTVQGDPFIAWLDSDAVGANAGIQTPGVPFITGFTPVETATDAALLTLTNPVFGFDILIPPIANMRIRLLTVDVYYVANQNNDTPMLAPVQIGYQASSDIGILSYIPLHGGVGVLSASRVFSNGLDFPLGDAIRWFAKFTDDIGWRNENVGINVTYQRL